ncbi:MAG: hypothetical protein ABJE66_06305 [Deltaproteobacteria bacterium]
MNGDDRTGRLISRLLSGRDQLSRGEKDAILDGVLADAAPTRRAKWGWLVLPALALAGFLLVPWRSSVPRTDFAARGGGQPAAVMHVSCAGGCTEGSKLVFDVHGTTGYRYFAAFAQRGDGVALWYFPTADTATGIDLARLPATGIVDRSVVLGTEHPAGTYHVYGVFSREPLARSAIRDAFDPTHLTAGEGTKVVSTQLVVR